MLYIFSRSLLVPASVSASIPLHSWKMSIITRRLSCLFSNRSRAVYLTKLPTHILLQTYDSLPASAIGCLALTSKAFSFLLPDARSGLQLPSESLIVGETVVYPSQYQHQRYIFSRLLEIDLHPHQFLCWDCFTLHPRTAFDEYVCREEIRLSRRRVQFWTRRVMFMSCSRTRRMKHPRFPVTLAGIVDLCPCIKLTPTRKRRIEAILYRRNQQDGIPLPPWHTCFHQYHKTRLEIKTWLYLKDSTGPLMARIEYRRTAPRGRHLLGSRSYCPHQSLDLALCTLSKCHDSHEDDSTCANYRRFKSCSRCKTELIKARLVENSPSIMITHIACFERCLSDQNWIQNAVYLPQMSTQN